MQYFNQSNSRRREAALCPRSPSATTPLKTYCGPIGRRCRGRVLGIFFSVSRTSDLPWSGRSRIERAISSEHGTSDFARSGRSIERIWRARPTDLSLSERLGAHKRRWRVVRRTGRSGGHRCTHPAVLGEGPTRGGSCVSTPPLYPALTLLGKPRPILCCAGVFLFFFRCLPSAVAVALERRLRKVRALDAPAPGDYGADVESGAGGSVPRIPLTPSRR